MRSHWVPVYLGAADNLRAALECCLHANGRCAALPACGL